MLERWREKPEAEHLSKLAQAEVLIADLAAAQRELGMLVSKLIEEVVTGRVDELLAKERSEGLNSQEKEEFQRLILSRSNQRPVNK